MFFPDFLAWGHHGHTRRVGGNLSGGYPALGGGKGHSLMGGKPGLPGGAHQPGQGRGRREGIGLRGRRVHPGNGVREPGEVLGAVGAGGDEHHMTCVRHLGTHPQFLQRILNGKAVPGAQHEPGGVQGRRVPGQGGEALPQLCRSFLF